MDFINLQEVEEHAKNKLEAETYDFIAGGACDEITLNRNRTAFDSISLVPRMLTGTCLSDFSTNILSLSLKYPILNAPMAFSSMVHPNCEIALANALKRTGLAYIASSLSTTSLAKTAEDSSCPMWFQIYLYKDQALNLELIQEAEVAGVEGLVITIDVPIMGRRERDIRHNFSMPSQFVTQIFKNSTKIPTCSGMQDSPLKLYSDTLLNNRLTWDDISWLKENTSLPIILKGIMRDSDAETAISRGVDAIIISNHGGRQLDSVPSSIELLPKIANIVNQRIPLLLGGGIRRGTDIVKALALGANAVLLGRPLLWGAAVNGEEGVVAALDIITKEFTDALILCGYDSLQSLQDDKSQIIWND